MQYSSTDYNYTEIIIMIGNVALVTALLYFIIYEDEEDNDDEDYYTYPVQAVDQGENGIVVFPE